MADNAAATIGQQWRIRQRKDPARAADDHSTVAEGTTDDQTEKCPMTGKSGKCPVSGMLSGSAASSSDAAPKKADPFAAGSKKMVTESASSGGSAIGDVGSIRRRGFGDHGGFCCNAFFSLLFHDEPAELSFSNWVAQTTIT